MFAPTRRSVPRAALLAGMLLLAVPAPALAAPALDGTFGVSDKPGKLAVGADGNAWVVVADKLARITPAGVVTEFNPANMGNPVGITAGPDGNLWLTEAGGVVKADPANPDGATKTAIVDIVDPRGITAGPDGNLWTGSGDKLIRIPPAAPNTATSFPVLTGARGITSSGGLLWVADFGGQRIVSATTAGAATPYATGGGPQEVGAGPNGQIAYANPGAIPHEIGTLSAGGTPTKIERPLADPFGIAFGADGAYWIAEFAAHRLARLTPEGAVTTFDGLPANSGPREIVAGPSNTLWVSLENVNKVARISGVEPPAPPSTPTTTAPTTPTTSTPTPTDAGPAADATAPVISDLRISPRAFRLGTGGIRAAAAPKRAATIRLTLSEPARVRFTVERLLAGRRVGGRCVAPTRAKRARRACTRAVRRGPGAEVPGRAGANTYRFSGRTTATARLAPGRHRLVATATDAAGNRSRSARAGFTILAPGRR